MNVKWISLHCDIPWPWNIAPDIQRSYGTFGFIVYKKGYGVSNKYIYSVKIYLCLKNFYIQTDFFSNKKYIFVQSKKICSMKYFDSMIFGNQIWSSICKWNSLKLLYVLYSDFDARVKHKNKPHFIVHCFAAQICLLFEKSKVHFYK